MKFLLLGVMTVLPGSALTFGIPLRLNWRTRLALGVALSPVILASQLYLLRLMKVDFAPAVLVMLGVNLPVLILLKRPLPRFDFGRLSVFFWAAFVTLSALVGLMLVLWLSVPNLRIASWHALIHTDIIYQIARNPFQLEEPDMANIRLAVPWLDHVYWTVIGWLTDWPPTFLYPITNVVWLLITFVLAYELASGGLALHRSTALLSAALTFVGTNVLGAVVFLASGKRELLGDVRFTPLLGKYFGFETILFALALIMGLALVCVLVLQMDSGSLWLLIPILLIGLGMVYPVLFPVGCILAGLTILLLFCPGGNSSFQVKLPVFLAVSLIVCIAVFLFYLKGVTSARSDAGYQISAFDSFKGHAKCALMALLPAVIIGLPFIMKGVRVRSRATLLLAVAGVGSVGMYLLLGMRNLEYKFVLSATGLLMPLAAGGIESVVNSLRVRWTLSMLVPVVFSLIFGLLIFKTGAQIPDNLRNTPQIIENSFWLQLSQSEEDSGWVRAVHSETPQDTVLVLHTSRIHVGPFANRSLFFPGLGDGDAMAGYSVDKRYYLLDQRGYSRADFNKRQETIEILYSESDPGKIKDAIDGLMGLHRPIAIHFANQSIPSLIWMKQKSLGVEIYSDSRNVVWLLGRLGNTLNRTRADLTKTSTVSTDLAAPSYLQLLQK